MRDAVVVEQREANGVCPKCGSTETKVHNKMETRLLHGLDNDFAVMYSIMECSCGNRFASYDTDKYPANDIYLPEVREQIRFFRFAKRISWTDIKRKMLKDYGLDIALNTIRNYCKEK